MKLILTLFISICGSTILSIFSQDLIDINKILSLKIYNSDSNYIFKDSQILISIQNKTSDTIYISDPTKIYNLFPIFKKEGNIQHCFSPGINPEVIADFNLLLPNQEFEFYFPIKLEEFLKNCDNGRYELYSLFNGFLLNNERKLMPTELCPYVRIKDLEYHKLLKCKSKSKQKSILKSNIITITY